jgi:hypothetical protein
VGPGGSLDGEWTITGGTGRFQGAEGHYSGDGVIGDIDTWVLEGVISTPGANKK